ncbi:uncharacterized protein CTRU02_211217 [Colletotrichum truncatum]|uniref:Uncharacterized protein n=1 Tax=Colletotrichum truncatum TaxID=5467 RepID=A0ACC3YR49_COLTU|nr:uncharacterized protein CTRU02_01996 [Colletotrichum truncatum]KAF6799125.1 hypothetical protein CTRU02_01996 [Colletotrichum truncatum]
MKKGLSDVHRHPPRPRARRQDRKRGRDHHRSLYSQSRGKAAFFAEGTRATKSSSL